jgi:hypothetical protein
MENMKVLAHAKVTVMEKNVHMQKEKEVAKIDHVEVLEMEKENHL